MQPIKNSGDPGSRLRPGFVHARSESGREADQTKTKKGTSRLSSCSLIGYTSLCDPGAQSVHGSWIAMSQITNKSVQQLIDLAIPADARPSRPFESKQSHRQPSQIDRFELRHKEALASKGNPFKNLDRIYAHENFDRRSLDQELTAVLALPTRGREFDDKFDLLEAMLRRGQKLLDADLIARQFTKIVEIPLVDFPGDAKLALLAVLLSEGVVHLNRSLVSGLRDRILAASPALLGNVDKSSILTSLFGAGRSFIFPDIGEHSDSIFRLSDFQNGNDGEVMLPPASLALIGTGPSFMKATLVGNLYNICSNKLGLDALRSESKKIFDLPQTCWSRQNQIHLMISLFAADTEKLAVTELAQRGMVILAIPSGKFSSIDKDKLIHYLFRGKPTIETCMQVLALVQDVMDRPVRLLLIDSLLRKYCTNMTEKTEVAEVAREIIKLSVTTGASESVMPMLNALGSAASHVTKAFSLEYNGMTYGPFPLSYVPSAQGHKPKDGKS